MAKGIAAAPWRNRIVGEGEEDPTQLLANPLNWRIHPGRQRDAIRGALADKSFYTVMMCPSFVSIRMMGRTDRRMHHYVSWEHAVPKILDPRKAA